MARLGYPGVMLPALLDRATIARRLRRDAELHVYELGDLDEPFWSASQFFVLGDAMALLYRHPDVPTLLALVEPAARGATRELLARLRPQLPLRLYVHLSSGLLDALAPSAVEPRGHHLKMSWRVRDALPPAGEVEALGPEHADELHAFYAVAHPDPWFDPATLATGMVVARRDAKGLAAVAGVHVYSPVQRVAALGNVATRPDVRGRGLATVVTAASCRLLADRCDVVGLNVAVGNLPAIALYRRLGFEVIADYDEAMLTLGP